MTYYDKQLIENHVEITHALARLDELMPDGTREPLLVTNPMANRSAPRYLKVSMPRKGFPQKALEIAREHGLEVTDFWQYDRDKAEDRIQFKLEPIPEERREAATAKAEA